VEGQVSDKHQGDDAEELLQQEEGFFVEEPVGLHTQDWWDEAYADLADPELGSESAEQMRCLF
jgi:hypothetical protein